MKKCATCKVTKYHNDFTRAKAQKDGFSVYCRVCSREKNRDSYYKYHEKRIASAKAYKANNIEKARALGRRAVARSRLRLVTHIMEYLSAHPCVDCGETDPIILEFDHVRGKKLGNVSVIATKGSMKNLVAEIAKCEIRCANCHRRKTLRGSYKDILRVINEATTK